MPYSTSSPVLPMVCRTTSGSLTPGISTSMPSDPICVTFGSDTPNAFTRLVMISIAALIASGVAALGLRAMSSMLRPPVRSRP